MKNRAVFIISFIFSLFLLCMPAYSYDPSYTAENIADFSPEIYADSGDISAVLKDAFDYDPRIVYYYNGYEGRSNSYSSILYIKYRNTDVPLSDIYFAESRDAFETLVTRALLSTKDKLHITSETMLTTDEISLIINSVENNCPLAFLGYRGSNIQTLDTESGYFTYTLEFKYDYDRQTLTSMKKELERKACSIIAANVSKDMPPYMKVFIIHNYIINNCRYASDNTSDSLKYTAYGALVKGSAVCDGYASAAQLLFSLCDIESIKISGTSRGEGHAWNLVKLDNEYYHIDTTWDDPVSNTGADYLRYDYYNLNDNEISSDHIWNKNEYPQATGSLYTYDKTAELIRNDTSTYTDGYTNFVSLFSQYPPLTGSTLNNMSVSGQSEITSSIVPDSILNETDENLRTSSPLYVFVTRLIENPYTAVEIIFAAVLIIAVLRRIF